MSTVDVNSVIVTGENSVMRLNNNDNDAFTTQAASVLEQVCKETK